MNNKGLLGVATDHNPKKGSEISKENTTVVDNKSSKLVSFNKWKNENTNANEPTDSIHKYEHELVTFSKWKNQTEEKYESLKKNMQVALPRISPSLSDIDEAEHVEELIESLPVEEKNHVENSFTLDDLASEIKSEAIEEPKEKNESTPQKELTKSVIVPVSKKSTSGHYEEQKITKKKPMVFRRSKRSIFEDVLTALLCLFGVFYSLYLFYESLNRTLVKIDEEPIATITFKYKSAQRKLSDRVLWDRVQQNTPIFDGDIIRTADFSEATITFADGNEIYLYENSLAQVFYSDDGAAVDFSTGGISIASTSEGPGVQLSNGENTVRIEADSELVANIESKFVDGILVSETESPITLQLISGNASFVAPEQLTGITLNEGISLAVGLDGNTEETPAISVFSPSANAKYLRQVGESVNVVFNWAIPPDSSDSYTFEMSAKNDFSELIEQRDVTGMNTLQIEVSDGLWHWRLYAQNPSEGKSGKVRIIDSDVPKNIVPAQNDMFFYVSQSPEVRFLWSEDIYATEWLFEVADNLAMENPHVSQTTTQTSSILATLQEGEWFWRVTPIYARGIMVDSVSAVHSNVSSFTIHKNEEKAPIQLLKPMEGDYINATAEKHYFTWMYEPEADSYTFTMSQNEDMSSIFFEQDVGENYTIFTNENIQIPEGIWYWTVTSTSEEGLTSEIGEVRSFLALDGEFTHNTVSPKNNDTIEHTLIETTRFTWENNLPYDTYFQIASDENFEDIYIEESVNENFIEGLSIPIGAWYWRIISNNGDFEHATSAKLFFVEYALEEVTLLEPRENDVVIVQPSRPVLFSWQEVEHAEYYEFQLYEKENPQEPVYENRRVEGQDLSINMYSLPKGEYTYSVFAVIAETASGMIRKSDVSQRDFASRIVEPIRLTSPRNGISIDGVAALMSPSSVIWDSTEEMGSTIFVLASNPRGLSAEAQRNGVTIQESSVKHRVVNPGRSITLPPLTEGTWYWTIIGENEEGYDITASQPAQIIVRAIENLQAPTVLQPIEGEVFDSEYFAHNNSITFAWSPVQYAHSYRFTLQNENKEVLFEKILENTSEFAFEDLSILDRGIFIWTIEASRTLNEEIVQSGEIAQFSFTIDLRQVISPQDRTTGDLYGL